MVKGGKCEVSKAEEEIWSSEVQSCEGMGRASDYRVGRQGGVKEGVEGGGLNREGVVLTVSLGIRVNRFAAAEGSGVRFADCCLHDGREERRRKTDRRVGNRGEGKGVIRQIR